MGAHRPAGGRDDGRRPGGGGPGPPGLRCPVRCTAMQAIGYKEMAAALRGGGDVCAAAEEIKLRSRQYAKRQLTWFRRTEGAKWLFWGPEPDFEAACRTSTKYLEEFGLV